MNTINIEDTVLYEDKYILVCQKPAGFPVQSKRLGTLDMECALRNYLAKKGQEPLCGSYPQTGSAGTGSSCVCERQRKRSKAQ